MTQSALRRRFWIPVLLAGAAICPAQKPADLVQKEEACAAASKAFEEAERAIRATYRSMENALASARAEQGAVWIAEMRRVLEGTAAAASAAAEKRSKSQVQAAIKREAPAALKKIENAQLLAFEARLAARLSELAADPPVEPARLDAQSLATLALAELLGEKPFHEFWNETFADASPSAAAYRKAAESLEKARWDLDVAKEPVRQYQRGAPPGFARVPAGTYTMLGTSGFGAQGSRKGRKSASLPRDVYIGLREVTHAEFFEWWKGLDPETRKKHLPNDGKDPVWPTPDGAELPSVPEDMASKPVVGVSLATAMLYAAQRGARLPTEAEWCAAASGRDGRLYPWGETWQEGMANDLENKLNESVDVGTLPGRGPFGHYDLAGNVSEWVATYESGKDVDPAKIDDANAVIRGGSFAKSKEDASNGWLWYGRALFDRAKDVGFRLAMDKK